MPPVVSRLTFQTLSPQSPFFFIVGHPREHVSSVSYFIRFSTPRATPFRTGRDFRHFHPSL